MPQQPSATPVAHHCRAPRDALTWHNAPNLIEPNTPHPNRIDLNPGVPPSGGVASAGAFDHEALDTHRVRQDLEPFAGLVKIVGDGRQLHRRCINRISLRG